MENGSTDSNATRLENGAGGATGHPSPNGHTPGKRKRGRPRLTPLKETALDMSNAEQKAEAELIKKEEDEEDLRILRRRRPGCKFFSLLCLFLFSTKV